MPILNSPVKIPPRFFEVNKELFLCLFCVSIVLANKTFALTENALGRFDLSASLSAEYDSRVFGISSQSLQSLQAVRAPGAPGVPGVDPDEIESEDDLILKFTPAIHYTKKLRWFTFSGSAGVQITQFVKNDKKSYIQPTSTFNIDFDESLKKRISNNAKIRFDMNFDLGQKVDTSVLEQDLVSYSYFLVAANVRYNHSSKFGLGAGTSYSYRNYQDWAATGGQTNSAYGDLATIPIYARAFYIYSEKLDFFTEYNFSRSRDMSGNGGSSLTNGATHGVSFGALGELSQKLSGDANIGYVRQVYDNASVSGQSTLSLGSGLQWSLNRKTSMGFDLNRGFSPSAQGYTMLNTTGRLSLNHRFTDDVSGSAYISYGTTDYTYASGEATTRSSNSLDNIGFGTNVTKTLSKHFTTSGGYSFSHLARDSESYGRHLVRVDLNGRF